MKTDWKKLRTQLEKMQKGLGNSDPERCMRSDLQRCIDKCGTELFREEMWNLGYENITENTSIYLTQGMTIGHSVHYHKNMIYWDERSQISWADDDRDCESGKHYVNISFSTGPYYILGNNEHNEENYRKAQGLFREMWKKILSYDPDACDSHNHSAYFEMHSPNAVRIWNEIDGIVKEYTDKFSDMLKNDKEAQIASLQAQIDKLKNS